jgi:hypothetical protein
MIRTEPAKSRYPVSLARIVAIACLASLVLASSALAQDPTATQYNTTVTQVHESSGPGSPPAGASGLRSSVVGGLPFTGLDLIALAAVAVAFTSVGIALRRMTVARHGDPAA